MRPQYPITEFQQLSSFTNLTLFIPPLHYLFVLLKLFKVSLRNQVISPLYTSEYELKSQIQKESSRRVCQVERPKCATKIAVFLVKVETLSTRKSYKTLLGCNKIYDKICQAIKHFGNSKVTDLSHTQS